MISQWGPRAPSEPRGGYCKPLSVLRILLVTFLFQLSVSVVDSISWFRYHCGSSTFLFLDLGDVVAGTQHYKIQVTRATTKKVLFYKVFTCFLSVPLVCWPATVHDPTSCTAVCSTILCARGAWQLSMPECNLIIKKQTRRNAGHEVKRKKFHESLSLLKKENGAPKRISQNH